MKRYAAKKATVGQGVATNGQSAVFGSEMKKMSSLTETTFCVESGHISLIKQGLTIITIDRTIIFSCSKEVFCPVR